MTSLLFCRDEATRTPDPYVPNVVRYQLRYIPLATSSLGPERSVIFRKRVQKYEIFLNSQNFFVLLHAKAI